MEKPFIHSRTISKSLLVFNVFLLLVYFSWWFIPGHIGSPLLYGLLFFGETYHFIMSLTFWFTIWSSKSIKSKEDDKIVYNPSVDIFVTVAGEPVEIVRQTVIAARDIGYKKHNVFILNDGFVAKKDNWKEIEDLARELEVECITRTVPGGAKAGNINNALKLTKGELVAVFDADMVPHSDFLKRLVVYFKQDNVGFVQTPQYYKNHELNEVTGASWEQQALFFGPILKGKEKSNAVFICGTNVLIRRKALEEAGGMYEKSIAEDFVTSIFIHQKGWVSFYVPDVLAEGLAPEDLLSYSKQQLRWGRGSLQVLFNENPIFKQGLSFGQKVQYIASALYYLNGLIVLIDMVLPLLFLFFGFQAVTSTTTNFAIFFIPFMVFNLYSLYLVTNSNITFRSIAFSYSSWFIQLQALKSILLNQKIGFSVTPKQAQTGNFLFLAYPHLLYLALLVAGGGAGILREGLNPSVATNIAWGLFNVALFLPFIYAAIPVGSKSVAPEDSKLMNFFSKAIEVEKNEI